MTPGTDTAEIRFGAGVPAGGEETFVWPRPPRRRYPRALLAIFVATVALIGALLWLGLHHPEGIPTVSAASVSAAPQEVGCGATVDLVGTLTTDGVPGTVDYQWTRSDTPLAPPVEHLHLDAGQRTARVHLAFTVTGSGKAIGSVTLTVLSRATIPPVKGTFFYNCQQ